jgi:hypothetical protein
MIVAKVKLSGIVDIAFGRFHGLPKLERESNEDYEARTWKDKAHIDSVTGEVYIPGLAVKNCLAATAKYLGMSIPGNGKSKYTKNIESGVLILDNVKLGVTRDDLQPLTLFVPASGIRGDGKRVMKTFPLVKAPWSGETVVYIQDEIITQPVLQAHLDGAGKFMGLGSLRIRQNGILGGFKAEILSWDRQ